MFPVGRIKFKNPGTFTGINFEASFSCSVENPAQGLVGQAPSVSTASNGAVCTWKPLLLIWGVAIVDFEINPLIEFFYVVPQRRLEAFSSFVDRNGMPSALDEFSGKTCVMKLVFSIDNWTTLE